MSLSAGLRSAWRQRGWLALALWPLSLPYRALVALRRTLYRWGVLRSERLPVPVIVVGNVIAGGAGKTPVTLALVRHLQSTGWQPGVISRGYGRSSDGCREVRPASTASDVGDEPLLIARATGVPVFVARRRAQAGRALLAAHPATDVIVCDDGLQHLALARTVEICVFNDEGVGNGFLLPAGPLREAWPHTVDAVLHTAPQAPPGTRAPAFQLTRQLAPYAIDAQGRQLPLTSLHGQALHAVAAIARPEEFFAMLRARGLTLVHCEALPDHYDFDSWQHLPDKGKTLICTEKDAVKLWPAHPWALAVPLHLSLPSEFWEQLDASLSSAP